MSVERTIRYDLIARLCPNATGAELRSVCTEAGMFAIRARRKVATEKDFLDSVESASLIPLRLLFISPARFLRFFFVSVETISFVRTREAHRHSN
jgi:26S proteasome regulatory subunit T1